MDGRQCSPQQWRFLPRPRPGLEVPRRAGLAPGLGSSGSEPTGPPADTAREPRGRLGCVHAETRGPSLQEEVSFSSIVLMKVPLCWGRTRFPPSRERGTSCRLPENSHSAHEGMSPREEGEKGCGDCGRGRRPASRGQWLLGQTWKPSTSLKKKKKGKPEIQNFRSYICLEIAQQLFFKPVGKTKHVHWPRLASRPRLGTGSH